MQSKSLSNLLGEKETHSSSHINRNTTLEVAAAAALCLLFVSSTLKHLHAIVQGPNSSYDGSTLNYTRSGYIANQQ